MKPWEKYAATSTAGPWDRYQPEGSSDFAGLSTEARGDLAKRRLGAPPEPSIADIALNVGAGALHAVGDIPAGIEQIATRYLPLPQGMREASENRIAEYERTKRGVLARPGGTAGYIGGQIGTSFIPGSGVAATAGKIASAVKPLAIGAGLSAVRPHETEASRAKAAIESVAYGAGAGVAMKGLSMAGKGVKRALTGGETLETTSERAARAATAEKRGYTLTLGEISGNKRIQGLEDASENKLGGTALAKIRAANKENTNKILSRRIGEETPEITTEWLAKTSNDIGEEFEALRALDKTIAPIQLSAAYEKFDKISKSGRLAGDKKIGGIVKDLRKRFPDAVTWNEYADLRSEWAGSVIGMKDRNLARRLGKFIGALDDAAEIAAPDAAPLKAAATKYREYLMIRNSVDDNGDIAKGKLVRAISNMRKGSYFTAKHGEDELIDVARVLDTFKNQIPSSGTAERTAAMQTIQSLGSIPGKIARVGMTGGGYLLGDITGAAGGYAAPYAVQKALMSKTLRKFLEEKAPRTRELANLSKRENVSRAVRLGALFGGN